MRRAGTGEPATGGDCDACFNKPRHGYFGGTVSAPDGGGDYGAGVDVSAGAALDWPEGDGGKGTQVAQK